VRRLLIRPGAIGDCIVSLPALEHLQTEYTEVWVSDRNVPLIRFCDRVQGIESTELNLLELDLARPDLRKHLAAFDDIVSWFGATRPEFRETVAGLPFRFFPALPHDARVHAVDYYLEQVGASPGAAPSIPVESRQRTFVVIHPFSGSPSKNWPLEQYRRLARELEQRLPVRWCAGPDEPLPEATRFENLYELAQWLSGARLYVGNDSGITHLAAAVGTPVVALFGPTDPAVWSPRGQRVRVLRSQPLQALKHQDILVTCADLISS
jgi:ADP-heptose:LPS heptosyltransferase